MDFLSLATQPSNVIISDASCQSQPIHELFEQMVSEFIRLLTHSSKPCCSVANSGGKDSTIVVIGAMEAYKRAICTGLIEPQRPLRICTVDTKAESLPMAMYSRHMISHIKRYAKECGINLIYQVASPELNSEYFVRWLSSKYPNNPTRSGDCTNILKLDPSHAAMKQFLADLGVVE